MSVTVCLAPANTVAYPKGGGHFWVYLQWALGLRALGCQVTWLEKIDPAASARETDRNLAILRHHLAGWGLADCLAVTTPDGALLPRSVADQYLDIDAAAESDLLLNFWHSLPEQVVRRFRRSALIDTDPGLLQIWMTTGVVRVAPHDTYFTIGETVGTPAALFPDCGLRWFYTPPAVFLPEWPVLSNVEGPRPSDVEGPAPSDVQGPAPSDVEGSPPQTDGAVPYTTVAHWWGGTFEFQGTTFCNEKRVSFLQYLDLPARSRVPLELAVCLAEYYEVYRQLMEPRGWRLREAWDVSSTPEAYRAYIQGSRGEFSCAKPAYINLETAWVSDRTLCYLASGKPAVVQHTGPSRILPDRDGLFRFRTLEEAAAALDAAEADYDRQSRRARALVEEHFDATQVIVRVLERALEPRAMFTT